MMFALLLLALASTVSSIAPPPSNDDCATPLVLVGSNAFDTALATTGTAGQFTGPGCASAPQKDLWYSCSFQTTGSATFSLCTAANPPIIRVYDGSGGCPSGAPLACSHISGSCPGTGFPITEVTVSFPCYQTLLVQVGSPSASTDVSGTFSFGSQGTACGAPSIVSCTGNVQGSTCTGCNNNGCPTCGCANSGFSSGSFLQPFGTASVSTASDTLEFWADYMTGNAALFVQSTGLSAAPLPFGDGMLCAATGIIRLGISSVNSFGFARFPDPQGSVQLHVVGGPLQAGDVRHYQTWYRDAVPYCTGETFNLTNAQTITWGF